MLPAQKAAPVYKITCLHKATAASHGTGTTPSSAEAASAATRAKYNLQSARTVVMGGRHGKAVGGAVTAGQRSKEKVKGNGGCKK